MTMTLKNTVILTTTCLLLAGCTSMNLFKDDAPPAASNKAALDLPAEEPIETAPEAKTTGLRAAEITKALSGKSWKWASDSVSGVTLYANDGSSLVEVNGKGTTTGKWFAKDGQLCESMAPNPDFLPKGKAMFCNPVSKNGRGYKVGPANFTLDG